MHCRLKFDERRQDWIVHDWYMVIFSDETKIDRYQSDGRAWVFSEGWRIAIMISSCESNN